MSKMLIVDDEEKIRAVVREYAEFEDFEVEEARDGMEAVNLCREKDYDIIVQYDDRYTIRLGGTDDLAYKIQYLTSILAELSDFQAGTIDLTDAANKKATFQPAG